MLHQKNDGEDECDCDPRLRAETGKCQCRKGKNASKLSPVIIVGHVVGDDQTRSYPVAVTLGTFAESAQSLDPKNLHTDKPVGILNVV